MILVMAYGRTQKMILNISVDTYCFCLFASFKVPTIGAMFAAFSPQLFCWFHSYTIMLYWKCFDIVIVQLLKDFN